jgi:hypothetical protein
MSTTLTAETPRSKLWENYPDTMTRVDYQYSHKNYLTEVYPRQISGWNLLRSDEQAYLVTRETVRWEAWKLEYPEWVDLN